MHRVDRARAQRGAGGRQPAGDRAGVVHLRGGGLGRQVQLVGQAPGRRRLGRRTGPGACTTLRSEEKDLNHPVRTIIA